MLNELAVLKHRRLEFLLAVACFGFIAGEANAQESVASGPATLVPGCTRTLDGIPTSPSHTPTCKPSPKQDKCAETVSVSFTEKEYTVTEGRNIQVKMVLSKSLCNTQTIKLITTPRGGAAESADYKYFPKKLKFKPNETEKAFTVVALEDKRIEHSEMLTIGFDKTPNSVIDGTPNTTTVKIIDASAKPAQDVLEALRARLTGGATFFSGKPTLVQGDEQPRPKFESPQFGQASPYVAFEAQPSVAPPGRNHERGFHRFSFEPLVNVRLTTIPIVGTETSPSISEGIRAPDMSFLQSQKAAQVQIGIFGSINFGGFGVGDSRFHWAGGPTGRWMFQSVTDEQRALRIWNIDDDLYDAWVIGGRLALNERSKSSRGWMPTAYIDISWGEFQNFEFAEACSNSRDDRCSMTNKNEWNRARKCLEAPFKCVGNPPPEDAFFKEKKVRTYIEGRIFFKSIYLGFDLNNGHGYDDLRFSAGVTVKLNALFPDRD